MHLNTALDFTQDTPGYRDAMKNDKFLGLVPSECDPDARSPKMKECQNYLYNNRELPNGELFFLRQDFKWNDIQFSSDSIIASLRYKKFYPEIIEIASERKDYRKWVDGFIGEAYTIGGIMLFPVPYKQKTINVARGPSNPTVFERFDLTLECIKGHYDGVETFRNGKDEVLQAVNRNADYFDKFQDFKGYVDFFFLQDIVDNSYNVRRFVDYLGKPNKKDYWTFMDNQMKFLRERNARISKIDFEYLPEELAL